VNLIALSDCHSTQYDEILLPTLHLRTLTIEECISYCGHYNARTFH
jgi:hypothetical protein